MQWIAQDNAPAAPISPTSSYHSQFHDDHTAFLSCPNVKAIYAAFPFLKDMNKDKDETTRTSFHEDPQSSMHLGVD
jgi:hypothetical protein